MEPLEKRALLSAIFFSTSTTGSSGGAFGTVIAVGGSSSSSSGTSAVVTLSSTPLTLSDALEPGVSAKVYQFDLDAKSDFALLLDNLDRGANVNLLNDRGERIDRSAKGGTNDEMIERVLYQGRYYVEVAGQKPGTTNYDLTLSATPKAGPTIETARILGDLNATFTLDGEALGPGERMEVFQFDLNAKSDFSLLLDNLDRNADVRLLDDRGRTIERSARSGTNDESIERLLDQGRYYVKVTAAKSGTTEYDLTLAATAKAGDSIETARILGDLDGDLTLTDESVTRGDRMNVYQFDLNTRSDFALLLDNLDRNATVKLLDDRGRTIEKSANTGTTDETIERVLEQGRYYVKVTAAKNVTTSYDLNLTATPKAGDSIETARILGDLNGDLTLTDEALNPGESTNVYQFDLNTRSDFALLLDNLDRNATVRLLDDRGRTVEKSANTGTSDETIERVLDQGRYYVKVTAAKNGTTHYDLSLTATPKAGDTITTARILGDLNGDLVLNDEALNPGERKNVYQFDLNARSEFTLLLDGLDRNADVKLLDDRGRTIERSARGGTNDETIERVLEQGRYYVEVTAAKNGTTEYNLSLSATPQAGDAIQTARILGVLGG